MKIPPIELFNFMIENGLESFFGVPDSLLKDFCCCVDENVIDIRHIITANEGNAVAMAAGYNISTGKIPVVYMQNSGFGNASTASESCKSTQSCKSPQSVTQSCKSQLGMVWFGLV